MARRDVLIRPPDQEPLEISSGSVIGGGRDARSFYIRRPAGTWVPTFNGGAAQGKLPNLRAAQALTRHPPMTEQDAEDNTDAFIAELDGWWAKGVHAFTIGLQGGNPETSTSSPARDQGSFTYDDSSAGAPTSLFDSSGGLRSAMLGRLERVLDAMGDIGMVAILNPFYGGQAHVFGGSSGANNTTQANAAVDNLSDWLIAGGYTHILVDVANEAGENASSRWQSRAPFVTDAGVTGLIERFQTNFAGTDLANVLVGCSNRNPGTFGALTLAASTFVPWHANQSSPGSGADIDALKADTTGHLPPIVCNENERTTAWPLTEAMIDDEEAMLQEQFDEAGSSPGTMPDEGFQRYWEPPGVPFEWGIGSSGDVTVGDDRTAARNYNRRVADKIEALTGGTPTVP
jgi:hypothetical protein